MWSFLVCLLHSMVPLSFQVVQYSAVTRRVECSNKAIPSEGSWRIPSERQLEGQRNQLDWLDTITCPSNHPNSMGDSFKIVYKAWEKGASGQVGCSRWMVLHMAKRRVENTMFRLQVNLLIIMDIQCLHC